MEFVVGAGCGAEHGKPSRSHSDDTMYTRHTHSHVYQQIRSNSRQNDVEIHSAIPHRAAEKSFVGFTKLRQRDEVCGRNAHADEQGEEAQEYYALHFPEFLRSTSLQT